MEKATIFIDRLRMLAFHGVLPQERKVGGEFLVSLKVTADISKAIENDRVDDTVSYAALKDIVVEEMEQTSELLEHVAGRIANHVCRTFPQVETVEVTITKVNPPMGPKRPGCAEFHQIRILDSDGDGCDEMWAGGYGVNPMQNRFT